MQSIRIGQHPLGPGKPPFIIAEAGVNHNGRLDLALKLVDAAAKAGADAIKFQTFKADDVVTATGPMAPYQKRNTKKKESQRALLEKLELKEAFYQPLIRRCKKRGIIFLSTPHGGFKSVDMLAKLRIPAFKFGSADLTNLPVLAYAARFKKPMLISTGMANMKEIAETVATIRKTGNNAIVILQCTTDYPTRPDDANLRSMRSMAQQFKTLVGFSDHTEGTEAGIIAIALGASVIEKHITLDKTLEGPDHRASAEPHEFTRYVRALKSVERFMGSPQKTPSVSECQNIPIARKSIVSTRFIKKGERFSKDSLAIKRPGTGMPPREWGRVLSRRAARDIAPDQLLTYTDIV